MSHHVTPNPNRKPRWLKISPTAVNETSPHFHVRGKKAKSPKNQRQVHRSPIAAGPAHAAGATEAHGNSSAITKS